MTAWQTAALITGPWLSLNLLFLALVGLDIRQVAYVPPSLNRQTIHIRQSASTEGKQSSDYPFARALFEIGASL